MRKYWYKMPIGAGSNPEIALGAKQLKIARALIVSAYALACEAAAEKPLDKAKAVELIAFMLDEDTNLIHNILLEFEHRNLIKDGRIVGMDEPTSSGAERQKRHRDRKRGAASNGGGDVTSNVTRNAQGDVTSNGIREEKKREEKTDTPLPPQGGVSVNELFNSFWEARATGKAPDSQQEAEKEFHKLVDGGMDARDLVKAMMLYADWCRGENIKPRFVKRTAAWLKEGLYAQYLHQETAPLVDTGMDLPAWQQPLCQLIKPHLVRSFFKDADFNGSSIVFPKKFSRDYVAQHMLPDVKRCIGDVGLEVRANA